VEEIGRKRPTTVAELMEEANRFADGEDAYNNKRGCSPEGDRTSKQRRRHRSRDNQGRQNQVAAGYEAKEEEGYEKKEVPSKRSRKAEILRPFGRRHVIWTLSNPLRVSRWKESLKSPDEGLHNFPEVTKHHGFKPRRMARREARKSRISNAKASKAPRVESLHICNDLAGAQVKERVKEHIQASKPSNIIATSHYRILAVVRSTS
jgi:hypothetical protein